MSIHHGSLVPESNQVFMIRLFTPLLKVSSPNAVKSIIVILFGTHLFHDAQIYQQREIPFYYMLLLLLLLGVFLYTRLHLFRMVIKSTKKFNPLIGQCHFLLIALHIPPTLTELIPLNDLCNTYVIEYTKIMLLILFISETNLLFKLNNHIGVTSIN